MRKARKYVPVLLLILTAAWAWANVAGPPDGFTGAPGEGTCAEAGCHDSYPAFPDFAVQIEAPDRYAAGSTMVVRVRLLSVPEQQKRGFALTVLDLQDQPVGELIVTDPVNTQLSTSPSGRQYVKQTDAGSISPDSLETSWTLAWHAPEDQSGMVMFYVAACGADGDGTPAGDYIHFAEELVLDNGDCFLLTGDVNDDGQHTAADVIYLVNHIFRSGPDPEPCAMVGDVNCSGSLSASDIITLIGVVFKGQWVCNVCNLWVSGVWRCPALEW